MVVSSAETWGVLVAVHLFPWLVASFLIKTIIDIKGPGRWALQLGLGGAMSMPIATSALWLVDYFGFALAIESGMFAVIILAIGVGLLLVVTRHMGLLGSRHVSIEHVRSSALDKEGWARAVTFLLIGLVIIRFASFLPDVTQRPIFPWDAIKTWAWKARIWFDSAEILGFLSSGQWPTADSGQYVIEGVNHPDFVSMILLWSALAIGEWNDRFIGLAWLFAGIWSCLIMWGTIRFIGLPRLVCWLAVYLLISLPLVGTHVALYGYADLWMMLYLLAFCSAFSLWMRAPGIAVAALMVGAAFMMVLTKDSGVYWLPGLAAALLATHLSDRLLLGAAAISVVVFTLVAFVGLDPIGAISSGRYTLAMQPAGEVLAALGRHMFVWLDWHLLWVVVPVALIYGIGWHKGNRQLRGYAWLCAILLATLVGGFLMTRAGEYALIGTLFSRVLLQVVPAFVLLLVIALWHTSGNVYIRLDSQAEEP